ncbi:hypothetical protein GCM10029992_29300 [Glycomyces albus]
MLTLRAGARGRHWCLFEKLRFPVEDHRDLDGGLVPEGEFVVSGSVSPESLEPVEIQYTVSPGSNAVSGTNRQGYPMRTAPGDPVERHSP